MRLFGLFGTAGSFMKLAVGSRQSSSRRSRLRSAALALDPLALVEHLDATVAMANQVCAQGVEKILVSVNNTIMEFRSIGESEMISPIF